MKTIWLINQYASTPETGIGGRHHHLARELAGRGHRVYLIAASWHHVLRDEGKTDKVPFVEDVDGYHFVRLDTVKYNCAHDKRRVLGWFVFAWRVARLGKNPALMKPDVILYSSPPPIAFLSAERLARRFSCRLIFEVRDFWPLTLVEVGGKSPKHPLIRLMQWLEDRAYRRADRVVSNAQNAVLHMQSRGMKAEKFSWVANGFSLAEVEAAEPLPEHVDAQIPKSKFIVGYAGTLGLANSLDTLVASAEILGNREDIAFVLVGNGREKEALERDVEKINLRNVIFLDAVAKSQVQSVLSRFDVCFIAWKQSPLYQFGIAANKLFDYLYSARPIVHCYSGALDPVSQYGAGITVAAEDPEALADAILKLRNMTQAERDRMGENGRRAALENHEYAMLAKKLEKILFD